MGLIKKIITQREISRLCHITQINKVISILCTDGGILATDFIDENCLFRNDMERLDGRTDYISTSVQYPNIWYYRRKKYVNPNVTDWAVFLIDPVICEAESTLFCPVNAATAYGKYINSGVDAFCSMFAENVYGRIRGEGMLPCCTTNDQAEVLVYHNIPHRYIKGIIFENERVLGNVLRVLQKYRISYPDLYISEDIFDISCSNMVRMGITPKERLVVRGNFIWQKDQCS